ncbi:MAG TPA: hypothetical protein VMY69_04355 [Phycisphaerae bacterium]|nr:hypothetical protein [Phycisphaerae bacterium]
MRYNTRRSMWRAWPALALAMAALSLGWGADAGASVISAVGSAELISEGAFAGWYKYTYDVTWSLRRGLSHWDLVLKPACTQEDHLFVFDTDIGGAFDGLSTGKNWSSSNPVVFTVSYEGNFEASGDPSIGLTEPLIKWEPNEGSDDPGKSGVGTFWFYSNVIPEYGTFDDIVVSKYGRYTNYGDLTGAYPSCEVIPEPLTVGLQGVGVVLTMLTRRRNPERLSQRRRAE